jgi:DNA-binding transcriptional MocR family regulator
MITSSETLYENVATKIESLIEQGVLQPGDKVPSVRKVSIDHGVSLTTAFQAYFLLENKGLIESKPRSGFYVKFSKSKLPPTPSIIFPEHSSNEVKIDEMVSRVFKEARNEKNISLAVASPHHSLLPVAQLNKAVTQSMRKGKGKELGYEMPPGNEDLRRLIAKRSFDWGGHLHHDDVMITFGCMEALNLCLRAVAKPGDTIAIESPTYYGILQSIESLGMKALEIATHHETGVDLDDLSKALEANKVAACLFVTNFNNPLGCCMPEENKKKLVRLLAEKEIPLIEDDLYGDLFQGKKRPVNAKAFDKKGLVLLCSSFSKSLAPGYRVGWVVPGRFKERIERLKFMTTVATSTINQMALAHFLENGSYDRHLRKIRTAFQNQINFTTQAIIKYFPAETKISRPQGGFVLWIELPSTINSFELNEKAVKQGVSIAPGLIFSTQNKYSNFIRISCGLPWSEKIEQAIKKVGDLLKQQIGKLN